MTPEQQQQFTNYYNLTSAQKLQIVAMVKDLGMTHNEVARKFKITDPDVRRILSPPKNYGNYTAEQKAKHWLAGQKKAITSKKQHDAKVENQKLLRSSK